MLDSDLAELYEVQTKVLVQAVKRNLDRFPADFISQLENQYLAALRSQFVTSNKGRSGRCTAPYAFTEQPTAGLGTTQAEETVVLPRCRCIRLWRPSWHPSG